MNASRIINIFK